MNNIAKQIIQGEPLHKYCTFQTGGPADYFFKAQELDDLPAAIRYAKAHNLPYFIFGRGSNLLFDDAGFRGLIIQNATSYLHFEGQLMTADSGVITARAVQESLNLHLSPLEKWIGLPGTIGGAVYGNAGCNGLETQDILHSALLYNPTTDQLTEVTKDHFHYNYRHSTLKDSQNHEIILRATFQLHKSSHTPEEQRALIAEINKFRITRQPLGLSSGSFFKNPSTEQPAGYLIDQAGLKGHTINQAQISQKHGNFLLNLGGAKTVDIIALARLARQTVKQKYGITLENEVQIISQTGPVAL